MSNWIFVTGGAGYIGSHICARLKEDSNNKVLLIDINGKLYPHATQYCDLFADEDFSGQLVNEVLLRYRPSTVIHAAEDNKINFSDGPYESWKNNHIKNLEFMNACAKAGVKKFIYLSSDSVYSNSANILKETDKVYPNGCLSRNKLSTEFSLSDFYVYYGMNNISFRISNVFGCNQKYNLGPLYKSHGVQYNIFESLVLNKPFEIYGSDWNTKDGTLVRDFLHVDDVVDAIISSITWLDTNNGSHFMNLSSGVGMSLNELKSLIESTLSVNINMIYAGRVPAKPDIRILDNSLIKSKLAWKCKRDYNDAIRSMFQWYTGNIFKSICYS